MKLKRILAIVAIIFTVCQCGRSDLVTGPIVGVPELSIFSWGDGINDLQQEWTVRNVNISGWFYGSSGWGASNADVYVYSGLADITTVTDASVFAYTSSYVWAQESDYVFFRGVNGYYGAWRIDDIYPSLSPSIPHAYLDGQWYFQDDGSASFVPVPGALLLGSIGLSLAGWLCRRRTP